MPVTKEQVHAAADRIAAAGERPTLHAVRQIVGGSYSTISPALAEWEARQKETAAPVREPLPQAVADRLAELGADVWAAALALADSRLTAEREALEQSRAEHEAAQAEATELADKLAAEIEALQTRLATIEAAEQAVRAERDQALQEASKAREEAAKLTGQCEALQVQAAALLARLVPQAEA